MAANREDALKRCKTGAPALTDAKSSRGSSDDNADFEESVIDEGNGNEAIPDCAVTFEGDDGSDDVALARKVRAPKKTKTRPKKMVGGRDRSNEQSDSNEESDGRDVN